MRLKVEVGITGPKSEDTPRQELARLLRKIADRIEDGSRSGSLHGHNATSLFRLVGTWDFYDS